MRKDDLSGIELLAPAGNMASALAAFDAGADAVYCGLKKFNARDRSENFTPQEMSKLIAYAHKNGKKVHITFNTLIKEPEIPAAAEELSMLADMGPDAVIVQDIGILAMIRDFFPMLQRKWVFTIPPGLNLPRKQAQNVLFWNVRSHWMKSTK